MSWGIYAEQNSVAKLVSTPQLLLLYSYFWLTRPFLRLDLSCIMGLDSDCTSMILQYEVIENKWFDSTWGSPWTHVVCPALTSLWSCRNYGSNSIYISHDVCGDIIFIWYIISISASHPKRYPTKVFRSTKFLNHRFKLNVYQSRPM